ncbi:MAG: hypothetical protein ABIH50_02015 [bacterium]
MKNIIKLNCPICEYMIEIVNTVEKKKKQKERITCPNCFAQLGLFQHEGKYVLACALCQELVFDPGNCGDCERRREKKRIIEEGKL